MIHVLSTLFAKDGVFSALLKGSQTEAVVYPPEQLTAVMKQARPGDLLYVELGKDAEIVKKTLRTLAKLENVGWAILDPWGVIEDIGALFHSGALDYLGPKMRKIPLKKPRIAAMQHWAGLTTAEETQKIPSFDPEKAKLGKEYSFVFLLVELADQSSVKRSLGEKRLPEFRTALLQVLQILIHETGGVLWMQQEYSFLVAYPDTALSGAVSVGLKLVLSRALFSLERFGLREILSFKMALHRGTAPWQKPGDTGNVISDAVNSLFHLGQKRARKNTLTLTETCVADFPARLYPWLQEDGEYEGRRIYRLPDFQP